jgi:hypothetical protein
MGIPVLSLNIFFLSSQDVASRKDLIRSLALAVLKKPVWLTTCLPPR